LTIVSTGLTRLALIGFPLTGEGLFFGDGETDLVLLCEMSALIFERKDGAVDNAPLSFTKV